MIKRKVGHSGDMSLSGYVTAGDYTFLAHHGGNLAPTIEEQLASCLKHLEKTLNEIGVSKSSIVQLNLYLKDVKLLPKAEAVLLDYFGETPPARTTIETNLFEDDMLCQIDGIAYTPQSLNK